MRNKYYTSHEVAKALNLTVEYIRKLIRMGKIQASKPFGNRLYIDADEFDKIMNTTLGKENKNDK